MVADHQGNLHRQLPAVPAKADPVDRGFASLTKDRYPGVVIGKMNIGVTAQTLCQSLNRQGMASPG